jgi:YVTN family beta-propeller protein
MDYEGVVDAQRLISKMGGGQLLVVDLESNKLVAQLDGFPKVTGVLVVPELHKVYASVPGSGVLSSLTVGLGMAGLSSGHGALAVRDTRTLKELARLPAGVFPDGIAYDPRDRRIFVSDELGSAVTAIDAVTDKVIARIDLGGEAGNVPTIRRAAMFSYRINRTMRLSGSVRPEHLWSHAMDSRAANIPTALSSRRRRIGFIACDENDNLVTVELSSGRVLNKQPVAHDPDVLAIDPRQIVSMSPPSPATLDLPISAPISPLRSGMCLSRRARTRLPSIRCRTGSTLHWQI